MWPKCGRCEILERWNHDLQQQVSILQHRVSDLQDKLFERDEKLADERKELQDAVTGRIRPSAAPQQPMLQVPRRKVNWSDTKSQLEADSRRKMEAFAKQMREAEEKGTLPRLDEVTEHATD